MLLPFILITTYRLAIHNFSSVQWLSRVWLFVTPWTAAPQAFLSISSSWSLLKLMSIESVMPSNHLILCRPLLLPPSIFLASGSFPMSQFFTLGGQSIGVSASASVLPMNIQDRFPLGWTVWISLQSKGLSRVFNTTVQKNQQSYSLFCPFSLDSGLCFISLWLRGFFSMTYVPLLLLSVLADSLICHTYTAFWNDPTQNIFFIIPNTLWVCYYKNQFSSVAQSRLTLCDPMNHSTPGLPVHHQLPDSTQTHVHLLGATLGITDKMEARSPAPSPHSAGTDPGMKELGLIILTCLFLSSAELTEKEY